MPVTRRRFISYAASAGLGLSLPFSFALPASTRDGYEQAIVIDGLGFPGGMNTQAGEMLSAAQLGDIQNSGLTATHLTVGAVGTMPSSQAFDAVLRSVAFWDRQIDDNPDVLVAVNSTADIDQAKSSDRTGLIYGLQDGVSFEDDLGKLGVLHQFRIRIIQPTYNRRNLLGDGCMEPANAGLSRAGRESIERMNDLGILVDLSHCGRQTAANAIAVSTRPIAFTHTGCAALVDHPRHRSDQEMRAVAERGGVTGIYVMPYLNGGRQPTAADVLRHIDHAVNVAGEDHVALGTDGAISPTELTPEYIKGFRDNVRMRRETGIAAPGETDDGYLFASDLNESHRFEILADMMTKRGYTESRVDKILGRNLLRVCGEAWG